MKKLLLAVGMLFVFVLCDAQVKTRSNNDGDEPVTISDVTNKSNTGIRKSPEKPPVIDAESINAMFQSLLKEITSLQAEINKLKSHDCSCDCNGSKPDSPADEGGEEGGGKEPDKAHGMVDLGLSVKWATCNIGASSPEEFGDYFAWGATEPQDVYDWNHAPYQTQDVTIWDGYRDTRWLKYLGDTNSQYMDNNAKENDANKKILTYADDAAQVKWGYTWRMPRSEEIAELVNECYWQWVTSYNGKEVNGYVVYKAKNESDKGRYSYFYPEPVGTYSLADKHIFLPACGNRRHDPELENDHTYGFYWSSSLTLGSPYYADHLHFSHTHASKTYFYRFEGYSIRPVCP